MAKQPEFQTIDGVDIPRVGTVLNLLFGYPPSSDIVKGAMKLGSQVDAMINEFLQGKEPKMPKVPCPGFHNAWQAFGRYYTEHHPDPTDIQRGLASRILGWCGTPDAYDTRQKVVTDFKVATAIRSRYFWQTNAYIPLIEADDREWENWKRRIVRLDARIGEYEIKEEPFDLNQHMLFSETAELWMHLRSGGYDVKELRKH